MHLRHALRIAVHSLSVSATALVLTALGIGAATATFSVLRTFLRPLPFSDPERLVMLWARDPVAGIPVIEISHRQLDDWMHTATKLEGASLVSASNARMNLLGPGGEGRQVLVSEVSANFCSLLGVTAVTGRCFSAGEDRPDATPVAMLTESFWRRAYGSSRHVIGGAFRLNGIETETIGVLPGDVHLPQGADVITTARRGMTVPEDLAVYVVLARFAQQAAMDDVQAEMNTLLERENHDNAKKGHWVIAVTPIEQHIFGDTRVVVLWISAAVLAVLLIATSNLMTLLLTRTVSTGAETAIRSALGATRAQLAAESVLQTVVLCAPGGVAGIILAANLVNFLSALVPGSVPRGGEIVVDRMALSFGLVATVLVVVVAALPPALRAVRNSLRPMGAVRHVGADSPTVNFRSTLLVVQVALTVVLLGSASLVFRSFVKLGRLDGGFEARGLVTAKLNLGPKYDSGKKRAAFYESALDRLAALPMIESADVVLLRPLSQPIGWEADFTIEGQRESAFKENPFANLESVSAGYFRTMRIPVIRGRAFTQSDGHPPEGTFPPIIVSENLANRYWPGEEIIGRRLKFGDPESRSPWQTVIGVVGNVRYRHWGSHALEIYVPYQWWNFTWMDIVVRTRGDSDTAVAAIRTAVADLDREVTLSEFETFESVISGAVARPRFSAALGAALATVSLVLAGAGLYGLLTFSVAQRRRELSVRMAMGATRANVVGLVLRQGLGSVIVGLLAGLVICAPLSHLLGSLLFEVSPTDVATYAGASTFLVVMALVASYLPAREAVRIDPVVSLRHE